MMRNAKAGVDSCGEKRKKRVDLGPHLPSSDGDAMMSILVTLFFAAQQQSSRTRSEQVNK
jgi:hypothetical protein